MRMTVQITIDGGGGEPAVVREVFALERGPLAGDNLGLRVGEAKDLLAGVQESMVAAQVEQALADGVDCPDCGRSRRHKDARTIVVRTLFGRLRLSRPPLVALPVRAAADRDVQGLSVQEEDMARLPPFVHSHLGVHGAYTFALPDLAPGTIRDLRDPDTDQDDDEI